MNNHLFGITAAGNWMVDYIKEVTAFPEEGASAHVSTETIECGGAPYNVLVNLCRMQAGFPLRAVGRIGRDIDGKAIVDACRGHGIEAGGLIDTSDRHTGYSDIFSSKESGLRTVFKRPGVNAELAPRDFAFESEKSRLFYLGTVGFLRELDQPHPRFGTQAAAVLHVARGVGMTTCTNLERIHRGALDRPMRRIFESALKETDIIILNSRLATQLTERKMTSAGTFDHAAAALAVRELLEQFQPKVVVVRHSTAAASLSRTGETCVVGSVALPRQMIVSALGAGHAFEAGYLLAFHEGMPPDSCLRLAHAAAAACMTHITSSRGIRPAAHCLALYERYGERPLAESPVLSAA